MIVIDASVAVKWVVDEAEHDIALRLATSSNDFLAPSIMVPELVNVLRKKVLRKEITSTQAKLGLSKAIVLIERFVEVGDMADSLMSMSIELDHAAYDCCYIVTALRGGASLVTADRTLQQKAQRAGVKSYSLREWFTGDGY